MIAEFIGTTDPRWASFLDRCRHDVYHLPQYLELMGKYEGGEPVAFYAEEGSASFLAPLLIRALPTGLGAADDWSDATAPYGYPTPLLCNGDRRLLAFFIAALLREGRREGLVSAFFRLHPLITLPQAVLNRFGFCKAHGETVYIDLRKPADQLWLETRRDHRRQIRKLENGGFSTRIDVWDDMPSFVSAYEQTMSRLGATEFYHFPDSYYADLKAALGEKLHLCSVITPDGDVAGAALFFEADGLVQYHLGATADSYFRYSPSKLFIHHIRAWGQANGAHTFHLGGGVGGSADDSLFRFKSGFSSTTTPFLSYRLIFDRTYYLHLAGAGPGATPRLDGYFPSYREFEPAPVATTSASAAQSLAKED